MISGVVDGGELHVFNGWGTLDEPPPCLVSLPAAKVDAVHGEVCCRARSRRASDLQVRADAVGVAPGARPGVWREITRLDSTICHISDLHTLPYPRYLPLPCAILRPAFSRLCLDTSRGPAIIPPFDSQARGLCVDRHVPVAPACSHIPLCVNGSSAIAALPPRPAPPAHSPLAFVPYPRRLISPAQSPPASLVAQQPAPRPESGLLYARQLPNTSPRSINVAAGDSTSPVRLLLCR